MGLPVTPVLSSSTSTLAWPNMPEEKGRRTRALIGCCWTILDGVQKQCSHSRAKHNSQEAVSRAHFRRLCPPEMDRLQLEGASQTSQLHLEGSIPAWKRGTARLRTDQEPSACLVSSLAVSLILPSDYCSTSPVWFFLLFNTHTHFVHE